MLVGFDGGDVDVGDVLHSLAEFGNGREAADGAGEGGCVREYVVAAV